MLRTKAFVVAFAGMLLSSTPVFALGELMVVPPRTLIEGRTRSAVISLINNGKEPTTYRFSIVNRRMNESGKLEDVKEASPEERLANSLIRFSPREVVLPPGGAQNVVIRIRKPADLPAGEYRSHLLIQMIPPASESRNHLENRSSNKLQVRLIPLYCVTTPIIVRHGETSAEASLSDLRIQQQFLCLTLHRKGSRSLFGDLTVHFLPDANPGKAVVVSSVRGIGLYTPTNRIQGKYPLSPPAGTILRGGKLLVSFKERPEQGGNAFAEAFIDLPK